MKDTSPNPFTQALSPREIAHEASPRCTGGTGYGPGGDGVRWHSRRCDKLHDQIALAIRAAVEAEREACAMMAHGYYETGLLSDEQGLADRCAASIAAAIRARGSKPSDG